MSTEIHPTAIVDKGAELDSGVVVEPYAIVGPGVRVGKQTRIGAHAVVEGNTTIGAGNTIFHHASVGAVPQDLKFHGEDSELILGDNNTIREFATLHMGTENGGMVTKLGSGNLIMNYAHVGHDCIMGDGNIIANGGQLGGHVIVENFVRIGGLAGIHQFTRLGENAIIGGGSIVVQDVPPYCMVAGDRAKLHGLNLEGLRRSNKAKEAVSNLKKAYRMIFRRDGKLAEALADAKSEFPDCTEVQRLVTFIEGSQRGVVRE